jgi:hypothetical protein
MSFPKWLTRGTRQQFKKKKSVNNTVNSIYTTIKRSCININDRVRKIKIIFWNFSDPIVEVNAVVRHFRHPWVLIRNI